MVARGFEERLNLPKDSPTVDKDNIRILLSIAAGKGWTVNSSDVSSAFLQGEDLERTVYLKPPKELKNGKGKLMKLRTALYGLSDASLQWWKKLSKEIKNLGCTQSKHDPALYFKLERDELQGLMTVHVDDFLHTGEEQFYKEVIDPLKKIFKMGEIQEKEFTYVGFEISQSKEGIIVSQESFVNEKIELFEVPTEMKQNPMESLGNEGRTQLRQAAGKLGWVSSGSRPDLSFTRVELSTKFNQAQVRDLVAAGKAIRNLKSTHTSFQASLETQVNGRLKHHSET